MRFLDRDEQVSREKLQHVKCVDKTRRATETVTLPVCIRVTFLLNNATKPSLLMLYLLRLSSNTYEPLAIKPKQLGGMTLVCQHCGVCR
jgi:hypothetical protein